MRKIGLIGEELVIVGRSGFVPLVKRGDPSRSDAAMVGVGFNPRFAEQNNNFVPQFRPENRPYQFLRIWRSRQNRVDRVPVHLLQWINSSREIKGFLNSGQKGVLCQ